MSRIVLYTDAAPLEGPGLQRCGEAVERFSTALPPSRLSVRSYTILRLTGSHSTLRFSR